MRLNKKAQKLVSIAIVFTIACAPVTAEDIFCSNVVLTQSNDQLDYSDQEESLELTDLKEFPSVKTTEEIVSEIARDYQIQQISAVHARLKRKELEQIVEEKKAKQKEEDGRSVILDEKTRTETAFAPYQVKSPYEGYFTRYMDLSNRVTVTATQMNRLIDYWVNIDKVPSVLTGLGQAYIDASNQTGLDPIFLLALTGAEAGWGVTDLHRRKNNPYSIRMYDENPEAGYVLGDTFYDGIINGAIWIKEHYYNEGQTTLYDMIYGPKCYSTAKDHWINNIVRITETSYHVLFNK